MNGGAWPFLVRGVICQAYPGNERDQHLHLRRTRNLLVVCVVVSATAHLLIVIGCVSVLLLMVVPIGLLVGVA